LFRFRMNIEDVAYLPKRRIRLVQGAGKANLAL